MAQMIEHAEEEHDVEAAEFCCRELADIEREVFDARIQEVASFEKGVEGHAIDGDYVSAAPLAFETEPAVPGADIEDALAAQIFGQAGQAGQAEEAETPAQVFDGLEAGENAAIGQFD